MIKKEFLACIILAIFILPLVSAEKIEITPLKDTFVAGQMLSLKVSLFDNGNNPIKADVSLEIEDAERRFLIKKVVVSNELAEISLGDSAPAGYWRITGEYNGVSATAIVMIESNDLAKFEVTNNTLTIINIGNVRYTKTVQIVIGDSIGTKEVDLGVGERISFRLVAPAGTYNVRVTDGKTTYATNNIALTGNVIGILDNRQTTTGPLTSGMKTEESPYDESSGSGRSRTIAYVFVIAIFAAAILLVIERRYKKSALKLSNYQLSN